ncbi:hypothetical protein TNCV_2881591 [Trichonephila clavipes]|nr:hypothetical protein TNCV_2881591 [Trichonephila clavipes]
MMRTYLRAATESDLGSDDRIKEELRDYGICHCKVYDFVVIEGEFIFLWAVGDEAPFWLSGYVNKQNCRIWSEANPQVYVETPLNPEKLTVWCALWAGGILLQKR